MFRTFEARLSVVAVAFIASSLLLVALVSHGFFRASIRSYYEARYELIRRRATEQVLSPLLSMLSMVPDRES